MLAAYDGLDLVAMVSERFRNATWRSHRTKGHIIGAYRPDFVAAAKRPSGSMAWYMAVCRDGATYGDYWDFVGYPVDGVRFQAFPTARPPQDRPTSRDLASYAQSVLDLPAPVMDRNPKLAKVQQAAVVGFPTWFWVTNPAATGAPTGTRFARARAGNVRAEVTATATGPSGVTGGDLGVQPHTWTTTIPVAEIQTIVNGVRQ